MNVNSNELIAGLFSDPINIQILCSIYENEVTADTISNILDLTEEEVNKRLDILCKQSLINRRQKGNNIFYSLSNPIICDSILKLKDSIGLRR